MSTRIALLVALGLTAAACGWAKDDDEASPDGGRGADASSYAPVDAGAREDAGAFDGGGRDAGWTGGTPTCSVADDCPYWYCSCREGPPVNTRHCTNGLCENAAQACPTSCRNFNTCWLGSAAGGWDGGTNAGPNDCARPDAGTPPGPDAGCGDQTSFTDLGKNCTYGTECQSSLCYGTPSYSLVCTKRCADESNCPKGWKCVPCTSGFDICMLGDVSSSSVSTNATCSQISFSDVGQSCYYARDCQSGICMNAGYCSRRCETSAECPGMQCTSINDGMFKACVR